MQYLTSFEKHRELNLMAFLEKSSGMIDFYLDIVLVGLRPDSDLFECSAVVLALFAALTGLALLFI
jgi:hypothetical protein